MPISDFKLITPATIARPRYLESVVEAGFDTTLTRIAGDFRTPIVGLAPEDWDLDARHGYSRRSPWNYDGTLVYIEQRRGSPSKMILDAAPGPGQWQVIKSNTGHFKACTEVRWHPTQRTWMVGYNKSTRQLIVFDALTNATIKIISVPFVWQSSNGGFMGEGSLSNDGSMVCFGDEANNVCLIDIASGRVGPMQKVDFVRAPGHTLGNITVSPLSTPTRGKVVAKASDTPELVHVYDYGSDLVLRHRFESDLTLSHGDVGLTPDGREVFVGGARTWFGPVGKFSKDNGNIAAIYLDNGEVRNISAGKNQLGAKEAADQHCSCQGPDGWVGVTYAGPQETSGRFLMELALIKLDGSREMFRFGVTRTNESKSIGAIDPYRNESHGVWSRDGKRVMFASNNQWATLAKGSVDDVKSFVYELGGALPPPLPALARYYLDSAWNYTPAPGIVDRTTGKLVPLAEAARLLNLR